MIAGTFGALFVGGIVAVLFSGVVTSQAFSYFKSFPDDLAAVKALAAVVWGLDFFHSVWVTIALWDHLIANFGDASRIDYIPWSLALTIAFTAILTFLVHLFFVYRIYRLSHGNIYICLPLVLMACGRLCFACLTTAKLIQLRSLKRFVELYTFSFTSGLALSSALDIFITSCMVFLLAKNQKTNSSMNHVLDKLILYTFENGSLTCAATLASLICWLTDKSNLIFLGLHFVISKFYANSLFATLNARKNIKQHPTHRSNQSNSGERGHAVMFPDNFNPPRKASFNFLSRAEAGAQPGVQIQVDKTRTISDDILMGRVSDSSKDNKETI